MLKSLWNIIKSTIKKGYKFIPFLVGLLIVFWYLIGKLNQKHEKQRLEHKLAITEDLKKVAKTTSEIESKEEEILYLQDQLKEVDDRINNFDKRVKERLGGKHDSKDAKESIDSLNDSWD